MELLLTGRRLPRFAFLLGAMLAELMLAPFLGLLPDGLPVVHGITAVVLLAAAEALIGQLYLAIMIARLVGLHTTGAGGGDAGAGPPAAGARGGEAEHG